MAGGSLFLPNRDLMAQLDGSPDEQVLQRLSEYLAQQSGQAAAAQSPGQPPVAQSPVARAPALAEVRGPSGTISSPAEFAPRAPQSDPMAGLRGVIDGPRLSGADLAAAGAMEAEDSGPSIGGLGRFLSALGRGYEQGGLLGGIGDAILSRQDGPNPQADAFRFLTNAGLDATAARAAVSSPKILETVLGQMFPKQDAAPNDVREYMFSMAQRKKAGLGTVPFDEWDTARRRSSASQINVGATKGFQAADRAFGEEYSNFVAGGGYADAQKNLAQIEEAARRLGGGKEELTGWVTGNIPDWAQAAFNPEAINVREGVEEVVQRNLRLILGAQFTQKEGERLIARAYNPSLDEKVNADRLRRLAASMRRALETKAAAAQWFAEKGTLAGFQGSANITTDDIISDAGLTDGGGGAGGGAGDLRSKYGLE